MPTQSKSTAAKGPAEALKPRWFHILLALADSDRNGLEIMREVLETTDGRVQLWPGALYGSLKELVRRGLVAEVQGEGKAVRGGSPRFYRMTSEGRGTLQRELLHMEELLALARRKNDLKTEEQS